MNYDQAMDYIEVKSALGSVPGLDNITELLNVLGNPQNKCRCLHIAGTNGKGSVFSFVQNTLVKAGYSVGRYISPTIFEYRERFMVNEKQGEVRYITEKEFTKVLEKVKNAVDDMESRGLNSPTAFEIETAVAFMFFVEKNVDYALIECGMGGRLDATNVIDDTFLSVIASISMDHMQFLGDTLSAITIEKAGIIKEKGVCIAAPQEAEAAEVLSRICDERKAKLVMVSKGDIECVSMNERGCSFTYKGEKYHIGLVGEYQLINASLAIEVLKFIEVQTGKELDIMAGLESTKWPGRFTIKSENPLVVIDGAHNEAAWKSFAESLNNYFTKRRFVFIIGVLKDKEYMKMADILCPLMEYAIVITPDSPRALDKEILEKVIKEHGVSTEIADNADMAYELAFAAVRRVDASIEDERLNSCETTNDDEKEAGAIAICGSLSFLKPYLEYEFDYGQS